MPPASTRAALSAAAPVSASAMASLTSSFGTLHIASSRRAAIASSSSFSSFSPSSSSSSSSFSTAATSFARCCRWQNQSLLALSASQRPLLSSTTFSSSTPPSTVPSSLSSVAAFSTTPARESRLKRRRMRQWVKERATKLFMPLKAGVQLTEKEINQRRSVKASPFPFNDTFRSQHVLDEFWREQVWHRVRRNGESIKGVAASVGIDMRRVAAVVRLKEIEKSWIAEGKPMAKEYSKAVLAMLPTFDQQSHEKGKRFENINEIHTHAYTKQQLFVPVSESRRFTREDAARAFHPSMLPADKRMPIPELIQVEKDVLHGKASYVNSLEKFHQNAAAEQRALAEHDRVAAAAEEERTTRVKTDRFEFRIRDINADNVGPNGRSPHAVGWRYGVPFDDRKRGQVKIPTSVG